VLTRSGWAVVAGAAVGALAGRLFGVIELYILAAVATALVVVALGWVRRPVPELVVERRLNPPRVSAGTPARVEVSLTNRGRRRLPPVMVVDPVEGTVGASLAVGPLGPGANQEVGYRLPPLRRGPFRVGPLRAELVDPFGLARRRLPGVAELDITVLPAIDAAPVLRLGGGRHEPLAGLSRRVASSAGAEDLVTLRPYVIGDDLRRVHWPSTAHADELLVRRDEERWQGHVAVLIDTRATAVRPADFERLVSAAAGIVDSVAASGDRVRVATTSGTDSGMVDAQRAARGLLEDLALVDQRPDSEVGAIPQADPRRPVTIVVLTGPETGGLVAEVHAAGFADAVAVRFVPDGCPPSASGDAVVTVRPGEPFATAWNRAAARLVAS
jgi:uncharacterized protein (DUF58 family)